MRRLVVAAAGVFVAALAVAAPSGAQTPTASPSSSPSPAPPPPPPAPAPQAGTRTVQAQLARDGEGVYELRVHAREVDVAGIDAGWWVLLSVTGPDGTPVAATLEDVAITVTGQGGVPRAATTSAPAEHLVLLSVSGQRSSQAYDATYLVLAQLRLAPGTLAAGVQPTVLLSVVQ